MRPHTDFPALATLDALVHQQRRKVAARLRTEREERAARAEIERLLTAAGVEVVSVKTLLGTFEVRRAVSLKGERFSTVTPVGTPTAETASGAEANSSA